MKDAKAAFERAVRLGATPVKSDFAHGEMDIPAIEGIGGSRLFFVDTYGSKGSIYEVDFDFFPEADSRLRDLDSRLTYIDHLTHNVHRGPDGASGRIFTSGSSTSARFATSTSRESRRASSRRR